MITASELIDLTMREGCFVLHDFLPADEVRLARKELVEFLDEDLALRAKAGHAEPDWRREDGFKSELDPLMHVRYYPEWRCPTYAKLMAAVFENDVIAEFNRQVLGEHIRLRLGLARRATGVNDTAKDGGPPHTWHRDTPGEFTYGIFFDDMSREDSGGTCVIKGTHTSPYHALWDIALSRNTLLSHQRYIDGKVNRIPYPLHHFMPFNKALQRKLAPKADELRGTFGDIYFFFNDTWHGRAPNTTREKFITTRFGGFPTDFRFKDDMKLPAGIEQLPPILQNIYAPKQPVNARPGLIHRNCTDAPSFDLTKMAHVEKRAMATVVAGLDAVRVRIVGNAARR